MSVRIPIGCFRSTINYNPPLKTALAEVVKQLEKLDSVKRWQNSLSSQKVPQPVARSYSGGFAGSCFAEPSGGRLGQAIAFWGTYTIAGEPSSTSI
jgi:hypothetical protein